VIVQVENALSRRSCRRLMALYDRHVGHATGTDYTGHAVLYCDTDLPTAERAPVRCAVDAASARVAAAPELADPVYPETVELAALGAGGRHPQHSDNSELDEDGAWVPNHTPQRAVSALYYLNDAFAGGEIVFETQGLVVRPRPGLFLAFPSDERFVHEVLPVTAGRRYSLAIWFTGRSELALPAFRAS
jgi:hypothetical protein